MKFDIHHIFKYRRWTCGIRATCGPRDQFMWPSL